MAALRSLTAGDLPAYDGDIVSAEAHSRFLSRICRTASRAILPGPRPTAAGLERHAARFGPEQVPEVAAEYGISVAITRAKAAPKRVRGTSLQKRVAAYLAQGHGVDVIAELEDLTPGRARTLVNAAMAAQVKEGK